MSEKVCQSNIPTDPDYTDEKLSKIEDGSIKDKYQDSTDDTMSEKVCQSNIPTDPDYTDEKLSKIEDRSIKDKYQDSSGPAFPVSCALDDSHTDMEIQGSDVCEILEKEKMGIQTYEGQQVNKNGSLDDLFYINSTSVPEQDSSTFNKAVMLEKESSCSHNFTGTEYGANEKDNNLPKYSKDSDGSLADIRLDLVSKCEALIAERYVSALEKIGVNKVLDFPYKLLKNDKRPWFILSGFPKHLLPFRHPSEYDIDQLKQILEKRNGLSFNLHKERFEKKVLKTGDGVKNGEQNEYVKNINEAGANMCMANVSVNTCMDNVKEVSATCIYKNKAVTNVRKKCTEKDTDLKSNDCVQETSLGEVSCKIQRRKMSSVSGFSENISPLKFKKEPAIHDLVEFKRSKKWKTGSLKENSPKPDCNNKRSSVYVLRETND